MLYGSGHLGMYIISCHQVGLGVRIRRSRRTARLLLSRTASGSGAQTAYSDRPATEKWPP